MPLVTAWQELFPQLSTVVMQDDTTSVVVLGAQSLSTPANFLDQVLQHFTTSVQFGVLLKYVQFSVNYPK